jgi:hypothetical protein
LNREQLCDVLHPIHLLWLSPAWPGIRLGQPWAGSVRQPSSGTRSETIFRQAEVYGSAALQQGPEPPRGANHGQCDGVEVQLSTAVIQAITFGEAVIHNVVVLVVNDNDLKINLAQLPQF